ncbi:uncharacterized protein LOC143027351 [Oratosquilla oratoria]|uniref:uncharacterized protein LOC143027351 n=1 Tax=Oratosquilla oratoria TaxID=337810 RepID=UPI003F766230
MSFADDTHISRAVLESEDVHHLQNYLDTVYAWANDCNMQFNEEKFEVLRYGTNQGIKDNTEVHMERGMKITPKAHVKCLGIYLGDDATFQHHIMQIMKRARGMASWVLRTFSSREVQVMLTLWKALIQPILDYCSQLWSPHKRGDIQKLEAVQRNYTRHIRGMKDLNYWDRLEVLGLYSQQRRRERFRAIYTWKILQGLVPDPTSLTIKLYHSVWHEQKCERQTLPPRAPERLKTLLASILGHEGPKIFNTLPKEVRERTKCLVDIKHVLDRFLRKVPDKPPVPGYIAISRFSSNTMTDQLALARRDSRSGSSGRSLWL